MQPRINRNLKLVELSLCHCIFFYLYWVCWVYIW